ncbi:MAG: ATP-binding protein [Velocimicrobium sp.]
MIKLFKKLRFSLFLRIYLYFAIILAFIAILIGTIFINLYTNNITKSYEQKLKNQGEQLASNIATYVNNNDVENYSSYILSWQEILLIENTDIWIIPNPDNPMSSDFSNVLMDNITLTEDTESVLSSAFHNKVNVNSSYDAMYGKPMMRLATPIRDSGGNVVGAVLLNTFVESQNEMIQSSRYFILVSALLAFLISFVIAYIFARQLSLPIVTMRTTALKLAEGDYNQKTGIERKDEFGDLAATIDILANRLAVNEESRKELDQMRLDFFANISHELRTPITVIRGYTETLNDAMVTDAEKIQQYYGRMLNECKSMERLVGDLLILSKMQNPHFEIEKEPVNLIQIFDDILRSASVIVAKKEISFSFKKDSDCIMMLGDYGRLRQLFIIIIDNAIKFSSQGSTIEIQLISSTPLTIIIRDEGIGISETELPNIFDKFYKSKLRQNESGSGLGLVIAKQIVLKHNGEVFVDSILGKGSIFTFHFEKYENSLLNPVE